MKDIEVKKREWVKTAAIVFLAVLLVLTFFSNTIMNRSLPEVAAQYTQSQTINSRIRGSGSVVANEVFNVTTEQAYKVDTVIPRLGDEVAVGDILMTLSQDGSSELETVQEELRLAELDLEKYLLTASPDSRFSEYYRAISSARDSLNNARSRRGRAADAYNQATGSLSRAQSELEQAKKDLPSASTGFNEARYLKLLSDITNQEGEVARLAGLRATAQEDLDFYIASKGGPMGIPAGDTEYARLSGLLSDAISAHFNALQTLNTMNKNPEFLTLQAAKFVRDAALDRIANAEAGVSSAREEVNSSADALAAVDSEISSAQQSLDMANESLADAQKAAGTENSLYDIEVREKNRTIDELRERLEKLEKDGDISEITSPVSGKITQVNITAQQMTMPGEPLMVIEVTDRGYSLTIPVSVEQSTKVSVGDVAEIDRGWWSWGEAITGVLTAIRPDVQNPSAGRNLVFSVTGDNIESGTQLNVTIAQRSENYGIVVPNSAVRSDTNGDFVLIVETRSSPLRNRYIATRVDVTVIAKDDINSAISGAGLSGWDFVITTSTRPIEPGMQVRLVDNN